eukprot:781608-Rhodomonas_salina.1
MLLEGSVLSFSRSDGFRDQPEGSRPRVTRAGHASQVRRKEGTHGSHIACHAVTVSHVKHGSHSKCHVVVTWSRSHVVT